MILFETVYHLSEIDTIAQQFLQIARSFDVWALSGPLGAGKTTFTSALLKALESEDKVNSPTFSIINQYLTDDEPVYHSDWYRIADEEEAINSGIEDMLQQPGIKIVEWWERAAELLPENTLYVTLQVTEEQERTIRCSTVPLQ